MEQNRNDVDFWTVISRFVGGFFLFWFFGFVVLGVLILFQP